MAKNNPKTQSAETESEIERLTRELDAANQEVERLTEALKPAAPSPVPDAPEPSPDELEILRRMGLGATRQQAVEAVERQNHYDKHIAPQRKQTFQQCRSRPVTVNNVG